jgi:hypothetical protein
VSRLDVSWRTFVVLAAAGIAAWWLTKASLVSVVVAVALMWVLFRMGLAVLRSLATPIPPPPPPGELRKVKIMFRCSVCGTEVRMTSANDEVPAPPRHCQEDMDLVAPIE